MASRATLLAILLLAVSLVALSPEPAAAQNCGCPSGACCSRWGYCGTGFDYCGDEKCREGPCWRPLPIDVGGIATQQFFDGIKNKAPAQGCPGRGFYTWGAFLDAARSLPNFGRLWQSQDDAKREIAAFFAHVTQETGSLCKVEEDYKGDYCNSDVKYRDYPCAPGRKYYGRGPLQVSWNYNYGEAGRDLGFNGLGAPETLATDARASFKASVWFWMRYARPVMGQGFGATTRAINGENECDGRNRVAVDNRARYYREYCQQLGVAPGGGRLDC
ncbi:hypothetical protein Taro_049341 [Colocasia esculenta]|uniref:chitinase n=1 Tax=Colocasia esculenta TaxID=4460 RepID=A0A843XAQ0_COLES|nr:hypothetical protein [Colocasia esculenta]